MTQVLDRETLDGRVVLNGTWEQFKLIQKVSEASPGIKLSFFAGAIEILMPGFQHENFSEIIGYLVTTFLLQQGFKFYPSGSMTQEKTPEASTQADKSFFLGEPKLIPDLSIEVVYTSGGLSKLPKYRALGVPEIWFWEDGTLRLYHLREDGYEQVIQSQLSGLETLDIDLLRRCILMGETDLAEAVKVFGQGISIDIT
ncbi:Uma2 family endonuclease [Microcoleus sp. MON1_C1]|uniref:Uma2 family endonuclease n=1 Tax=Microcoleus sp. MON1_C1 TaxID=2818827 RepID=UPI002FD27216